MLRKFFEKFEPKYRLGVFYTAVMIILFIVGVVVNLFGKVELSNNLFLAGGVVLGIILVNVVAQVIIQAIMGEL